MLKITYACCLCLSPAILSQFSVEMCAAAENCEKFNKTPLLGFKVNVDKSKKPVISACYDMQLVCTYLQPFSHYKRQQWQNNVFFKGVPLFDALIRGEPFHPGAQNFFSKN